MIGMFNKNIVSQLDFKNYKRIFLNHYKFPLAKILISYHMDFMRSIKLK